MRNSVLSMAISGSKTAMDSLSAFRILFKAIPPRMMVAFEAEMLFAKRERSLS